MMEVITVIVMQFLFIYFRTVNVICTAHDRLLGAMFSGLMINILWVLTTYYGIEAFKNNDIVLAVAYLAGGQVGVFWGMRKKLINNFLNSTYQNVKRKLKASS